MGANTQFRMLKKRQQETLAKAFIRLRKYELKSSNDNYVSQLVLSRYSKHWLCTFYQTMEDVVEGRWSMTISGIEHMIVDVMHEDVPMMTNIMTQTVLGNDGNLYEGNVSFINKEEGDLDEDD